MGLAVKTHLPHAPSAHFLTVGVRMVWIARSTTQGGEGCARRVRIAVRKTFTAVAFSALEREPSFYLGLCGPSLRSALQGCIAFEWGLGSLPRPTVCMDAVPCNRFASVSSDPML